MLVNIFEEYRVSSNKDKNLRKNRNKIVKFLAKFKNWNLPKSNFQNTNIMKKSNFLIFHTKVVFTKSRQEFT